MTPVSRRFWDCLGIPSKQHCQGTLFVDECSNLIKFTDIEGNTILDSVKKGISSRLVGSEQIGVHMGSHIYIRIYINIRSMLVRLDNYI